MSRTLGALRSALGEDWLYSVRMRANGPDGRHISGAERIVAASEVPEVSATLIERAMDRGGVAETRLSVDRRERSRVHGIPCLPVTDLTEVESLKIGCVPIVGALCAGLSNAAVETLGQVLQKGYDGRSALRGAALVDAETGARLDPDPFRGVRARHFDYSPEARTAAQAALTDADLTHFRTFEALALASKVIWSGVALEVCWSDEPSYRTGYIASAEAGYVRIPDFKPKGTVGGRVFFLRAGTDVSECVQRLQDEWALVQPPVTVRPVKALGYLEELRTARSG